MTPSKAFESRYRYFIRFKEPSSLGREPENSLLLSKRSSRFVKFPIAGERVPFKWFVSRSMLCSPAASYRFSGMGPVRRFVSKSKDSRSGISPRELGIGPSSILESKSTSRSSSRWASSEGSSPVRLFSSIEICSILPPLQVMPCQKQTFALLRNRLNSYKQNATDEDEAALHDNHPSPFVLKYNNAMTYRCLMVVSSPGQT